MIILGVDPSATKTGLGVYETGARESEMLCASFASEGRTAEAQADDFGHKFSQALDVYRPALVCHESAIRWIAGYQKRPPIDLAGQAGGYWTPNSDQMILPEIQGHLRQACTDRGIPIDHVLAKTWRASLYGSGGGKLDKAGAKKAAWTYCQRLGIRPHNHDEAEAACIAVWASRCSDVFRWLKLGRTA